MLVEAGSVRGRTVTSCPSLRTDIRNAGGEWVDQEMVVVGFLVTSRKPDDIPAFNKKMIEEFAARRTARRSTTASAATRALALRGCRPAPRRSFRRRCPRPSG